MVGGADIYVPALCSVTLVVWLLSGGNTQCKPTVNPIMYNCVDMLLRLAGFTPTLLSSTLVDV